MSDDMVFRNEAAQYRSARERADDIVVNAMLYTYQKVTGLSASDKLREQIMDAVSMT